MTKAIQKNTKIKKKVCQDDICYKMQLDGRWAENKLFGIPPWPPSASASGGSSSKSSTKSMDKNVPVVKKN